MPKITRQNHKILGGTGSSDNFAKFGSLVAAAPIKTKDIATIQSLPAWDEGFQSSIFGANKNLLLQDLNSAFYEHSYQIANILQDGVAAWQAATTYYIGSIVRKDGTFELYGSATNDNTGQALPAQANSAQWTYLNPPPLPPGAVLDYMGRRVAVGFLGADGSAVDRTTYAALLANVSETLNGTLASGSPIVTGIPTTANLRAGDPVSGTGIPSNAKILTVDSASQVTMTLNATSTQTPSSLLFAPWGVGDGVTTFNLLDSRRRVGVGSGGSGTATLGSASGAVGGAETHTLTIVEIPAHTHVTGFIDTSAFAGGGSGAMRDTQTGATDSTGGGGAHNNMQPSYAITKIIKF